ncbi:MAG: hypothetical protein PHZ06_12600, partial [Proteiniphilum sp.]|nr:hypothetical protein [Proteiniphilum sp.]
EFHHIPPGRPINVLAFFHFEILRTATYAISYANCGVVNITTGFKEYIVYFVYAVVRDGLSIASVCSSDWHLRQPKPCQPE